jgi:hypothetical protein
MGKWGNGLMGAMGKLPPCQPKRNRNDLPKESVKICVIRVIRIPFLFRLNRLLVLFYFFDCQIYQEEK